MLLFGVESADEKTLASLDEDLTVDGVASSCRKPREAGLEPYLTVIVVILGRVGRKPLTP